MAEGITGAVYNNWARTFTCKPDRYFEPVSVADIREILQLAATTDKRVRVIGAGQSPSDVCCTNDFMISLKKFNDILEVHEDRKQIKVQCGIQLSKLNRVLDEHGMRFPVLSAVDCISIGGIISTVVHGSGKKYAAMASYVSELEIMLADGSVLVCNEISNAEIFHAAPGSLGTLGILLTATLECAPACYVEQSTSSILFQEALPLLDEDPMDASEHGKYLFYPFSNYVVKIDINRSRNETPVPATPNIWFDVLRKSGALELILYICVCFKLLIPMLNRFLRWLLFRSPTYVRDKNYKVLHFDCLFSQYVTEWAIPKECGGIFIKKLRDKIVTEGLKVHSPIEIRFVKGDNFYLSPYYKQDSMTVNIVMFRPFGKNPPDHDKYFKMFEELAMSFGGRPHWAKKHTMNPEFFQSVYPKFGDFLAIRQKLDSSNLFVNDYVERHILGSAPIKSGYLDDSLTAR